jgi:biopolymer transport protein ExbD
MSKFRGNEDDGDETVIDMSPLIDCVFILLIFFIVTTVFVEEAGFEVDKPDSSPSSANQDESDDVVFLVKEDGRVFCQDREIGLSGVSPIVRSKIAREPEAPIVIRAVRSAKAGMTIKVAGEARAAGATKVSLSAVGPKG